MLAPCRHFTYFFSYFIIAFAVLGLVFLESMFWERFNAASPCLGSLRHLSSLGDGAAGLGRRAKQQAEGARHLEQPGQSQL